MTILGLGSSVPTPPEGITAPAYVVDTFDELDVAGKAGKVNGTILVYNEKWLGSYGATVQYRDGISILLLIAERNLCAVLYTGPLKVMIS
jgi:hypothetical protein